MKRATKESRKSLLGNEQGLTLVEVLVVLAIFAIMGSISMFVIGQQMPGMRLRSALTSVRGQVNTARTQAIRHGLPVILVLKVSGRKIEIWSDENGNKIPGDYTPGSGPGVPPLTDQLLYTLTLPDQVQFGFGNPAQADAPATGPDGKSAGKACWFQTNAHEIDTNEKFYIVITNRGWIQDPDSQTSSGIIFFSNYFGQFAALELLSGGAVIPWNFDKDRRVWAQT